MRAKSFWVICCLGCLTAGLWAVSLGAERPGPALAVGDKAPEFNANTDTGDLWQTEDRVGRGKYVVIYFYPAAHDGRMHEAGMQLPGPGGGFERAGCRGDRRQRRSREQPQAVPRRSPSELHAAFRCQRLHRRQVRRACHQGRVPSRPPSTARRWSSSGPTPLPAGRSSLARTARSSTKTPRSTPRTTAAKPSSSSEASRSMGIPFAMLRAGWPMRSTGARAHATYRCSRARERV